MSNDKDLKPGDLCITRKRSYAYDSLEHALESCHDSHKIEKMLKIPTLERNSLCLLINERIYGEIGISWSNILCSLGNKWVFSLQLEKFKP